MCAIGYSNKGSSCPQQTCSTPYCALCSPFEGESNICFLCEQGFFLSSKLVCIPYYPSQNATTCGVNTCLYCAYSVLNCSLCFPGYYLASVLPTPSCVIN